MAVRGRLWVRVLLLLCTHLGLPMELVFSQVGGLVVVDGYGFSSPPFRGCRVLKVVESYL